MAFGQPPALHGNLCLGVGVRLSLTSQRKERWGRGGGGNRQEQGPRLPFAPPTFGLGCTEGLVSPEGPCGSLPILPEAGLLYARACTPAPEIAFSFSQRVAVSSFYLCALSDWSFLPTKKLRLLGPMLSRT